MDDMRMGSGFFQALVLGAVLVGFPAWSFARTITVMQDGTGDYALLQPAADSAAPGDTLLIGPGRWTEVTPFAFNSGVRMDAHLVVRVDNLTVIGMDRDSVVLGPVDPHTNWDDPVGLVVAENVVTTRIESLSFENTWSGVYALGAFKAHNCVARSCQAGFFVVGSLEITSSEFVGNLEDGILMANGGGAAQVLDCAFAGNTYAIAFSRSAGGDVLGCTVSSGVVGIQYDNCPGTVEGCTLENLTGSGFDILGSNAQVQVHDNVLRGNNVQFDISGFATVEIRRNKILDATYAGVWIGSPSTVVVQENDLMSPQGRLVIISGHFAQVPKHYDFTLNWWGTTEPGEIASRIEDLNYDINIRAIVDFEPFAEGPVPAEATSFGGWKARFGGR